MDSEAFDLPLDRISPDTLRKMIEEFVTRDWSEMSDSGYTLDEKVDQVLQQLHDKRARIVYDSTTESWNIIPCR
ncbi:MAG: YheU family protein [Desulfuromonadaceae bacterium]